MLHEKAPQLLLDKIIWFSGIIDKTRLKNPQAAGLAEYESLLKVMRYCYQYMAETERLFTRNATLEALHRFLMAENQQLQNELNKYRVLTELYNTDKLDEEVEKVRNFEKAAQAIIEAAENARNQRSQATELLNE